MTPKINARRSLPVGAGGGAAQGCIHDTGDSQHSKGVRDRGGIRCAAVRSFAQGRLMIDDDDDDDDD